MVQTHFFVFIDPKSVVGACLNSDFSEAWIFNPYQSLCPFEVYCQMGSYTSDYHSSLEIRFCNRVAILLWYLCIQINEKAKKIKNQELC